jgi:hypothetical protein
MYLRLEVQYSLLLSDFSETFNFLNRYSKKILKYKILRIHVMWKQRIFSSGRTDKRKLIVAFRSILETGSTKDFWNDTIQLKKHR